MTQRAISALTLAAAAFALLVIPSACEHQTPAPLGPAPGAQLSGVTADLEGMPIEQLMSSFYEQWTHQKVSPPAGGWPGTAVIKLHIDKPVSTEEAARRIEAAVQEQAGITLQHKADGSIVAVRN